MSQPLRKRGNAPAYGSSIPASPSAASASPFRPVRSYTQNNENAYKKRTLLGSVNWHYLLVLSWIWLMVLFHFQRIKPKVEINKCQWSRWESFSTQRNLKTDVRPHRVLLIADPQIVDDHTYPSRPRWIQYITRKVSDNYMALNYKLLQNRLSPDTTIFLGDLFDGGREWHDDAKWYDEWKRFNRIFPSYPNRRFHYNILGNHDAGWDKTMNRTIVDRFKVFFGDSNDYMTIGNHTFLFLDTIALSATNNNDSSIIDGARHYLNNLTDVYLPELDRWQEQKNQNPLPRVLLTHVPFFRDPGKQACRGPRENKKPFPLVNGGTFQTVLFPDLTNELLNKLHPEIIFSGDDHDYCEIYHDYGAKNAKTHQNEFKRTTEITVKSFSMNMGVRYPAAQLLSLYNPLDAKDEALAGAQNNIQLSTYQTNICYPYAPFTTLYSYAFLLLATITFWVYVTIYPVKYLRYEAKIIRVTKPLLFKIINSMPFIRFVLQKSTNRPGYLGSNLENGRNIFKYDTEDEVEEDAAEKLRENNLKPKDYPGFVVNFLIQLMIIYLLFAYFFITV